MLPIMAADEMILKVHGLKKTFKGGLFSRNGFEALQGVDLEVGRGTVFGLLGPNGAGKTTMVKILLDLVRGYEGEAKVFGRPPSDANSRRRVGYLPEAHRMPNYLTGWQVMVLFGMLAGHTKKRAEKQAAPLLEKVGMLKDCQRKVREYSKGMQQRLGLAQALVHDPDLVFLDEPTDGVDPIGRAKIREMVMDLKHQGTTVFINSHLLNEVEMICDQVVILHGGKVLRKGTIDELTPATGTTELTLRRDPGDLKALLGGLGEQFSQSGRRIEAQLNDSELDATIDKLRGAGHTIAGVSQRRLTLEESFIDLVKEDRQ
ncbi:MAG: ABC-2 type transport system ATP-binding protein [Candidatus Paceibacteria bacterium]|jgi:ABC-2 type transport system ATP-binding protein